MTGIRRKYNELLDMIRKCNDEVNELIIQHECGQIDDSAFWEKVDIQIEKAHDVRMKLAVAKKELLAMENML